MNRGDRPPESSQLELQRAFGEERWLVGRDDITKMSVLCVCRIVVREGIWKKWNAVELSREMTGAV
jgi:hypothetical protein